MKLNTIVTGVFLGCLALAPLSGMTASLNWGKNPAGTTQAAPADKAAKMTAQSAQETAKKAKTNAEATKADVRAYVVKNMPPSDTYMLKAFDMDNPRFREQGTLIEDKVAAEQAMKKADDAMRNAQYDTATADYKASAASYDKLAQGYLDLKPYADAYYKNIVEINRLESILHANHTTLYSLNVPTACHLPPAPDSQRPKSNLGAQWNNAGPSSNYTSANSISSMNQAFASYLASLKDRIAQQDKYIADFHKCVDRK